MTEIYNGHRTDPKISLNAHYKLTENTPMDNPNKNSEIRQLEEKLTRLKLEQTAFDAKTEDQRLADILHSKLCKLNHTDRCGWCYESWDEPLVKHSVRQTYLDKARKLLAIIDYATAAKVLELL